MVAAKATPIETDSAATADTEVMAAVVEAEAADAAALPRRVAVASTMDVPRGDYATVPLLLPSMIRFKIY